MKLSELEPREIGFSILAAVFIVAAFLQPTFHAAIVSFGLAGMMLVCGWMDY